MNAFARLGLEPRPFLETDEITRRFDAAALRAHPDKGGDATEFAEWEAARQLLLEPARRLRLLLELAGAPTARGPGEVPAVIGQAFSRATAVCAAADATLARQAAAGSALAKAMLAREVLTVREQVETWLAELAALEAAAEAALRRFDADWMAGERAVEPLRDLAQIFAFVTRWTAQGRERLFALSV